MAFSPKGIFIGERTLPNPADSPTPDELTHESLLPQAVNNLSERFISGAVYAKFILQGKNAVVCVRAISEQDIYMNVLTLE